MIGLKVMLKWIKKLLSESAEKPQISTNQNSIAISVCFHYDNDLYLKLKVKIQKPVS